MNMDYSGAIALEDVNVRSFSFSENNSHVHWLKEGANYFGNHDSNDIIYQGEGVAKHAGILFLQKDRVLLRAAASAKVLNKRKLVDNVFIFEKNKSLILEYCSFKFRIIEEQGRYGLLIFR